MLVPVFQAALEASWQGSLAILLVGSVRPVLGTRLPARWRHALWLLVLVRLLVLGSVLAHSPASLQNVPILRHPLGQSGRPLQAPRDANSGRPDATATSAVRPRLLSGGDAGEGRSQQAGMAEVPSVKKAVAGWSRWRMVVGEKDVERLMAFGYTATCNPMGTGKWREHYSRLLAGKKEVREKIAASKAPTQTEEQP